MITNELLEYIKGEHLRGVSLESIKVILLENGWLTADIEEAFNTLYSPAEVPKSVPPVVLQQPAPVIDVKPIEEKKIEPILEKPIAETKSEPDRIQSILDRELQPAPLETKPEIIAEVKPLAEIKFEPVMEKPAMEIKPEPAKVVETVFKPEPIIEKKPEPVMSYRPELMVNPVVNPINNQTSPAVSPVVNPVSTPAVNQSPSNPVSNTQILGIGDSIDYSNFSSKKEMRNNIINPYLMNSDTPEKPKSHIKRILFIIFLVIVAAGSALATYAYYNGYFVSLFTVSKNAFNLAKDANGVNYDITTSIDMSGLNKSALAGVLPENIFSSNNLSFTVKGAYDKTTVNNFKLANTFNLNFGAIDGSVETKLTDGTLYAEITKMPTIALLGDMSSLTNKWVAFPVSGGKDTLSNLSPVTGMTGVDPSVFSNLSEEQKNKFAQMTNAASFIKITKRLSMETITNGPAYHFYFEPDSVGIKAYLQNVKDYVNSVGKDNSVLSAFDPVSQYDKASKSLKSFKGEAWIGKNDNLPQKIVISATSLVNADKPENGEFTVNIVAILKDWNKPLEVKAPVDSMSFAELMNQVMGQARTKAMDDSIKNSLTSFHSSADVFFQNASSYKGICLSKGAKDVSKQIKSINNGTSQFSCLDTKSKYIASVKLGDNTYFCTDSVGNTKGIPSKPIGFVCQ